MGIDFLHPVYLWVLPGVLFALLVWRLRRRRRYVAFSAVTWLGPLRHRPSVARRLPAVVLLASLASVVVALMDPVIPYAQAEIRAQGLDIVLVLDLSSSMQEAMGIASAPRVAQPVTFTSAGTMRRPPPAKTRLDVTKAALKDLVNRRRDDRIGLVVFSDNAYLVSPLTFDYPSLIQYIDFVDDQILRGEGMTAIGDGIALANFLLSRQSTSRRQNKVIVVFTDGEHNFGRDPIEVMNESNDAGYRVHVIGVDLAEEVKQKPAVARLIDTVEMHGGKYFHADTERQLRNANSTIDELERGSLSSITYMRNVPVYHWFAKIALALLVIGGILRAVPYFSDFT